MQADEMDHLVCVNKIPDFDLDHQTFGWCSHAAVNSMRADSLFGLFLTGDVRLLLGRTGGRLVECPERLQNSI